MKKEIKANYRMSPNELDRFIKEQQAKNRKIRLIQVRQQSKENAKKILRDVQQEKKRQIRKLAEETKKELEQERAEQLRKLEELYEENVRHVGEAHAAAAQNQLEELHRDELRVSESRERALRSRERGSRALTSLRQHRREKENEETRHIQARKAALQEEKERASIVSSRPAPQPNPVDSIQPVPVKPVKFTDLDAFSSTHFHLHENYGVTREDNAPQIDAKTVAESEQERYEATEADRQRVQTERMERARLRHKHALHKELTKHDYEHLLHDLSDLQREDRERRQKTVASIPKQIYAPPSRHKEEREEQQRDMERAFEDMYMQATDRMGDLSLALDPHPAPETPSATETLDLSSTALEEMDGDSCTPVDGGSGGEGVPAAPPAPGKDASTIKSVLSADDPNKNQGLRKLLDRIKSQRDVFVQQANDVAPPPAGSPDQTLTQYTATSGDTRSQSTADELTSRSDVDTLSTGEVESKTASGGSTVVSQSLVTSENSLDEGTVTSSGPISSCEDQQAQEMLLHPMEQAARIRKRPTDATAIAIEEERARERVRAQHRQAQLEEQKKSLEDTLREIEVRKRMLEERYVQRQKQFTRDMEAANQPASQPASQAASHGNGVPSRHPPYPPVASDTRQPAHVPLQNGVAMTTADTSLSSGMSLDKVHDYQKRALQRQGDKIEQLRQAKADLDAKVKAMLSKAQDDYVSVAPPPAVAGVTLAPPTRSSPHAHAHLDGLGRYSDVSPQYSMEPLAAQSRTSRDLGPPPVFPSVPASTQYQRSVPPGTQYQRSVPSTTEPSLLQMNGLNLREDVTSSGSMPYSTRHHYSVEGSNGVSGSMQYPSVPGSMQYPSSSSDNQNVPYANRTSAAGTMNYSAQDGWQGSGSYLEPRNVPYEQPVLSSANFPSYTSSQYYQLPDRVEVAEGRQPADHAHFRLQSEPADVESTQSQTSSQYLRHQTGAPWQGSTQYVSNPSEAEPSIASFRSLGGLIQDRAVAAAGGRQVAYSGDLSGTPTSAGRLSSSASPGHVSADSGRSPNQRTLEDSRNLSRDSHGSERADWSRDSYISNERDDFSENLAKMKAELEEIRRQKAEILERQKQHDADMEAMRQRWEGGTNDREQGLPGSVAVDDDGWATYSLPIEIQSEVEAVPRYQNTYSLNINEPESGRTPQTAADIPVDSQKFVSSFSTQIEGAAAAFVPHELSIIPEVETPNAKDVTSQTMRTTWREVLAEESVSGDSSKGEFFQLQPETRAEPVGQSEPIVSSFSRFQPLIGSDSTISGQVRQETVGAEINQSTRSSGVDKSISAAFLPLEEDPEQTVKSNAESLPKDAEAYVQLDLTEGSIVQSIASPAHRPLSSTPAKTVPPNAGPPERAEVHLSLSDYNMARSQSPVTLPVTSEGLKTCAEVSVTPSQTSASQSLPVTAVSSFPSRSATLPEQEWRVSVPQAPKVAGSFPSGQHTADLTGFTKPEVMRPATGRTGSQQPSVPTSSTVTSSIPPPTMATVADRATERTDLIGSSQPDVPITPASDKNGGFQTLSVSTSNLPKTLPPLTSPTKGGIATPFTTAFLREKFPDTPQVGYVPGNALAPSPVSPTKGGVPTPFTAAYLRDTVPEKIVLEKRNSFGKTMQRLGQSREPETPLVPLMPDQHPSFDTNTPSTIGFPSPSPGNVAEVSQYPSIGQSATSSNMALSMGQLSTNSAGAEQSRDVTADSQQSAQFPRQPPDVSQYTLHQSDFSSFHFRPLSEDTRSHAPGSTTPSEASRTLSQFAATPSTGGGFGGGPALTELQADVQLSAGRLSSATDSAMLSDVTSETREPIPELSQHSLRGEVTGQSDSADDTRQTVVRFAPGSPDVYQLSSESSNQPLLSQRSSEGQLSQGSTEGQSAVLGQGVGSSPVARLYGNELYKRIEDTMQQHDRLLEESRKMAEKHEREIYSYYNIKPLHFTEVEEETGITEEAELTLVSAAEEAERSVNRESEGGSASLLSFERHEGALLTPPSAQGPQGGDRKSPSSLASFERNERSLLADEGSFEREYGLGQVAATQGSSPAMLPLQPDASQGSVLLSSSQAHNTASQLSHGTTEETSGYAALQADETDGPEVDFFTGKDIIAIPVAQIDDPNETEDSFVGLTLAEAFAKKKKTFAHKSEKRREQARNKAAAAAAKGESKQLEMNQLVSSWKKSRGIAKAPSSGVRSSKVSMATTTAEDRKKAEKDMKERTSRLYSRLDEVQQKKTEDDKKRTAALNRERALQYNRKLQEKNLKKAANKK